MPLYTKGMRSCFPTNVGPLRLCGLTAALCLLAQSAYTAENLTEQFRRPVALRWLEEDRILAVGNAASGTISLIDLPAQQILAEMAVAERLADFRVLPGGQAMLVTDAKRHELTLWQYRRGRVDLLSRLKLAGQPAAIVVDPAGERCFVALLWSRRVEIVRLAAARGGKLHLRREKSVPLSFPPRELLYLPDKTSVLTADAFGGKLAVIAANGTVSAVQETPMHNLGTMGLNRSTGEVLIPHQVLHPVPTQPEQIDAGKLLEHGLRVLPLQRLLDPEADLSPAGRTIELGEAARGAADPASALRIGETIAVALAGVHEVVLVKPTGQAARIAVGAGPRALLASRDGKRLYVANRFDDSISVIDVGRQQCIGRISLGPAPPLGPRERGEQLFFDARLSRNGWMSCHSCHTEGHTNGRLADTLGDGAYGDPKRVLSLLGTSLTNPWAWNGSHRTLQDQVRQSVATTMHGPPISPQQVDALTTYLHALDFPPPAEPVKPESAGEVERGREVFRRQGCGECHVPTLTYTIDKTFDVGLRDQHGTKKFNPPSLRGVGQRRGFFHDLGAKTLPAVFDEFAHGLKTELNEKELAALVRFLRSL